MKSYYIPLFRSGNVLLALCFIMCSITALSAGPVPALKQMVADWQRAKEFTKEYLDAMPEDGTSYKPNADVRSFAEQMLHMPEETLLLQLLHPEKPTRMRARTWKKWMN